MKINFIFLILFFACQVLFAQTGTGISIQGIARDAEKAALVDETLTFVFEILDAGATSYYKEDVIIRTDPYGVFSHIIGTGNMLSGSGNFNDIPFGQTHMKLRITVNYKGNDIVLSNNPFQFAPYAKSAGNGVPTGTIVAFAGAPSNVPAGWALCDGRDLSTITGSKNLKDLIGNNLPDLRGMFLRGTGTSIVNGKNGPPLRGTQDDAFETHAINGTTSNAGAHTHSFNIDTGGGGDTSGDMLKAEDFSIGALANYSQNTTGVGDHNHTVTGTSAGGSDENRPVNYGVNYIIKL
jgi:hypothetical protein